MSDTLSGGLVCWRLWWVQRKKNVFAAKSMCHTVQYMTKSTGQKAVWVLCSGSSCKKGALNASWYSVSLLLFNYSGWTWIIAWIILLHLIWPQNMTNILAPLEGVCGSRYLWVWCTHPPLNSCPHTGSSMEPSTHADTVPNQLFLVAQSGDLMVMFNVRLNMRTGDR